MGVLSGEEDTEESSARTDMTLDVYILYILVSQEIGRNEQDFVLF